MFSVLPPPSKYPNGQTTGAGGGPVSALLETTNILSHPVGPEHQLPLGEGTYTLKDDLHLATPPAHPNDQPVPNNNPLATTIGPPTSGVKLSIAILAPRKPPTQSLFRSLTVLTARSIPPSIQEETQSPKSDTGSTANAFGSASYYNQTPTFGSGNPSLAPVPTKTRKEQKLKPKNNIVKSSSSFVSRSVLHEALPKRLSDRSQEGLFAFANINRAFLWLDLSSENKAENLTKVYFAKAHALCHDVNQFTKSGNHLDVVIGFNSADIIWYEPFSQKYTRLNKNGVINDCAVTSISWLPNKENLFVAAHMDGTLVVYDKEKDDADFVPEVGTDEAGPSKKLTQRKWKIQKSVQSRNQKTNPVAVWKISNCRLHSVAFSPDGQLLAVVNQHGTLTIFDYINERVLDVYRSYYGALLCVTWSPDGRYVLTGGEDDLVSIWSVTDKVLVARCPGHDCYVTDVKFDPWRCDERTYRFGSVGGDCRLLLWDFSVGMLGRPKALSTRPRGSVSSHPPDRRLSMATVGRLRSNSSVTQADGTTTMTTTEEEEVEHPLQSNASTAKLGPILSRKVDSHPLCWLGFEEHSILTSCMNGHIREWSRPTDSA